MGKIAKGVDKINFTMLYGNYCYIIIENFPQKFCPYTAVKKLLVVKNSVGKQTQFLRDQLSY